MNYRHTQIGGVMIAALVIMIVGAFVLMAAAPPPEGTLPAVIMLLAGLVLASFVSLTVEIGGGTLTCSFGPGFIKKRIPLPDIDRATSVRNPWYVGWGIRWLPGHYYVWNVSGFEAVELVMKNGHKFRIGTDEPEALVQAIASAKSFSGT
jgi:hypothetical protein